ncbi:MAG: ABC transporter ATP-binding protein [Syntrophobacteraceae bacterium]|nr:ABC transporter ATP-binding protein [Syntrophobacteraceae bacterium]
MSVEQSKSTLRKIRILLTRREKFKMLVALAVVLFAGLFQVFSVGSILPYVALLSNPGLIRTNRWLHWFYVALGFNSTHSFLIFSGIMTLTALFLANFSYLASYWVNTRVSWSIQHGLALRLFQRYLTAPYLLILRRSPADLKKNILQETEQFSGGVLQASLQLVSASVTVVLIVGLLAAVNPALTLIIGGVAGGSFALTYLAIQRKIRSAGDLRFHSNTGRYKAVDEGLGGQKELRVLGRTDAPLRQFRASSLSYTRSLATSAVLGFTPRYLIEVLGFGSILAMVVYLMSRQADIRSAIPIIGLFAYGGYRLLPAMNMVYINLIVLRFNSVVIATLSDEAAVPDAPESMVGWPHDCAAISFELQMEVKDVHFRYDKGRPPALSGVSITVPYKHFVGIAGSTGSGKTTLVDVILGLLPLQTGKIFVDGVEITPSNLRAWQNLIGYVPQDIYLADDTIARNIAFGVPPQELDMTRVRLASEMAQIKHFIEEELPEGYETPVGDRGVRLSGGQRQRIGIARALYHEPEVLILDEATSMLDGMTERDFMQAIEGLSHRVTLIVVAHRLTTLAKADCIYLLEDGRIESEGTFDNLLQRSERFSTMAQAVR